MKRALVVSTFALSAFLVGSAAVPNLVIAKTVPAAVTASVAHQGCGQSGEAPCVGPASVTFACGGFTVSGSHSGGTALTCSVAGTNVSESAAGCSGNTITVTGTNLDLTVPGAELFWINPSTGTATQVSAITGSGGEYVVCGVSLPTTGGAAR